jgi:hypothetical protein
VATFIEGDLYEPEKIFNDPALAKLLDLSRPESSSPRSSTMCRTSGILARSSAACSRSCRPAATSC